MVRWGVDLEDFQCVCVCHDHESWPNLQSTPGSLTIILQAISLQIYECLNASKCQVVVRVHKHVPYIYECKYTITKLSLLV